MGPLKKESKIGYLHACDIEENASEHFSMIEERNSILVSGAAYPAGDSRSAAACPRALDIAADSFLGRPSSSDVAVEAIAGFINDEIYGMQEKDKAFLCNLAVVYVFKGKTRVYTAGDAAAMFFDEGELKEVWYGGGKAIGSAADPELIYSDEFELNGDARFILVAGKDKAAIEETVAFYKENRGEEPEDTESFVKGKHCSYVNLYLPKRERSMIPFVPVF
ncbi:MAG: hypothetical protein IJT96_00365 [Lachnospiraceae bacterium]|nr:hypothetical protein [Lachnospiraceae bacterium]